MLLTVFNFGTVLLSSKNVSMLGIRKIRSGTDSSHTGCSKVKKKVILGDSCREYALPAKQESSRTDVALTWSWAFCFGHFVCLSRETTFAFMLSNIIIIRYQ